MRWIRQLAVILKANCGARTVMVFVALLLLAAGFALVYPPAGLIVPGALLFWLAVWPLVAFPPKEV